MMGEGGYKVCTNLLLREREELLSTQAHYAKRIEELTEINDELRQVNPIDVTVPVEGNLEGNEREAFKKLMKLVALTYSRSHGLELGMSAEKWVQETGAILNEFTYMHSEEPAPEGDVGKAECPTEDTHKGTYVQGSRKKLPVDDGTLTADLAQVTTDLMILMGLINELTKGEESAVLIPTKGTLADWRGRARKVIDSYWISEEEWSRLREGVSIPQGTSGLCRYPPPYVLTKPQSPMEKRKVWLPEVWQDFQRLMSEMNRVPEFRTKEGTKIRVKYEDAEIVMTDGGTGPRPSTEG